MPQFARPASDVSNIGWVLSSGSDVYALIDESSADDADYIQKTWNGTASEAEVALSAVSTPDSLGGHIVRYRARMTNLGAFVDPQNLQVSLFDGATLIASQTTDVGPTGTTWQTYSFTLTAGESGNITDYSDLRLKFEMTGGDNGETLQMSWAELQTPNAVASSGGFTYAQPSPISATGLQRDKFPQRNSGAFREFLFNTQESFGTPLTRPMRWADPESEQDALNGRVCSLSGHWFPARMLVWIDGKVYGEPFAPYKHNFNGGGLDPDLP